MKGDVSTVDGNWGGEHVLPRTEIQVHAVMRRRGGVPGSHLLETILYKADTVISILYRYADYYLCIRLAVNP